MKNKQSWRSDKVTNTVKPDPFAAFSTSRRSCRKDNASGHPTRRRRAFNPVRSNGNEDLKAVYSPAVALARPAHSLGTQHRGLGHNRRLARYVQDVTFVDTVRPLQKVVKIWRVRNDGDHAWSIADNSVKLVQNGGDSVQVISQGFDKTGVVDVGEVVDVSVTFQCPTLPGRYQVYWRLEMSGHKLEMSGTSSNSRTWTKRFGQRLWCEFVVDSKFHRYDTNEDPEVSKESSEMESVPIDCASRTCDSLLDENSSLNDTVPKHHMQFFRTPTNDDNSVISYNCDFTDETLRAYDVISVASELSDTSWEALDRDEDFE